MLATLEPDSFDACCTDPPYGLGFMSRHWDVPDNVAFRPETWAAVYRVLKPGAHLLAFGGTRTYHRLACAIEDAGFEIRDSIMWLYGSGFPKSLDVSKAIDRAAGAEREVVGQRDRYFDGWRRQNLGNANNWGGSFGTNGIDAVTAPATEAARQWQGWGTALKPATEIVCVARKPSAAVASAGIHALTGWDHWCSSKADGEDKIVTGRALHPGARSFRVRIDKDGLEVSREDLGVYAPFSIDAVAANVLKHGTGALNIDASRVATQGGRPLIVRTNSYRPDNINFQSGSKSLGENSDHTARWPANVCHDGSPEVMAAFARFAEAEGNPSRFFKCCPSEGSLSNDANAIIEECKRHANIADDSSLLRTDVAASVLTHAVTLASCGAGRLSACQGLGESVTARHLMQLCWSVITTILNTEGSAKHEQQLDMPIQNGSLVSVVAQREPIGIMTITTSHWKSAGSADSVTCVITPTKPARGGQDSGSFDRFHYCGKAGEDERIGSGHPTVKPLSLMLWLVGLVTPSGGRVLDPFAGTGSTLVACDRLGFSAIGIEQDLQTVADAREKILRMRARRLLGDDVKPVERAPGQLEMVL